MITGDENLNLLPRERLRTEDLRSIEVAVFSASRSAGPAGTAGVCRAEERAGVTIIQAVPRCSSDEHFAIYSGEAAARTSTKHYPGNIPKVALCPYRDDFLRLLRLSTSSGRRTNCRRAGLQTAIPVRQETDRL